jgi:hypothetical protein
MALLPIAFCALFVITTTGDIIIFQSSKYSRGYTKAVSGVNRKIQTGRFIRAVARIEMVKLLFMFNQLAISCARSKSNLEQIPIDFTHSLRA